MIIRTGIVKTKHFLKLHPYKLIDNEWKFKFPVGVTPKGKISTYNPDFFCPATGYFIEVTTSKSNMSAQGWRWANVIKKGLMLKVYWWEGQDITEEIIKKYV